MNNQHTPGPWRFWEQRRHPEDTCTFRNLQGHEVLRAVTKTLTYADARLIAAAPDLLAAAQQALAECVDLISTPAGDALVAAIAKALPPPPAEKE